ALSVIPFFSPPAHRDLHSFPTRRSSDLAASKLADEAYARSWANTPGLESVGLRYFNVFGPRQDPKGPYAAVIPLWILSRAEHIRSEEHTSELQSRGQLVCRLLLEEKNVG